MDKPRIQDDLYTYVNQEQLDKLVIPDDKPCIGGFQTIAEGVEKTMINDFNEMCNNTSFPNDYLKRACSLYMIAKNAKRKEKHGIKPALRNLKAITKFIFQLIIALSFYIVLVFLDYDTHLYFLNFKIFFLISL